jgi:BirA family biotin operon repressor/biotin-[acetyl-CoA-carboxylase] ligase
MAEARKLAAAGAGSGTVVLTDFQSEGRGRVRERRWKSQPGESLLFTVIFTKTDLSRRMSGRAVTLLPLLCGLAAAEAAENYLAERGARAELSIKWPNDVLAGGRKLCGILCEASGDGVFAGIGMNLNQRSFPDNLRAPACSVRQLTEGSGPAGACPAGESEAPAEDKYRLLELLLLKLDDVLGRGGWRQLIEQRLYMLGEEVKIKPGVSEDSELIEGRLIGINESGALLLETTEGVRSVFSGAQL